MSDPKTTHVHRLEGCRPTPLAHYLKALGILRLVAEQKDATARGWWYDDVFHLATNVDREELEAFFLEEYAPTPILSPWLKGSGFYRENDRGLIPIEGSQAKRFGKFRKGIAQCRKLLEAITLVDSVIRAIKARTKRDSTYQTKEQRVLLSKNPVFQSVTELLESKCNQLESFASDSENHDLDAELLRLKESLEEDGKDVRIEFGRLKEKLRAELQTIRILTSEPEKETGTDVDKKPTKAKANKLKASEGYKRILKLANDEFAELKSNLIFNCKRAWRGPLSKWFAAAAVIGDDETADWPALLGTGGNDGNLDFTNNSMQQLGKLFDMETVDGSARQIAKPLIGLALYNELHPGLEDGSLGQFFPGAAGGPNSCTGYEGDATTNPWDYVLLLEGAILFRAGLVRRCQAQQLPQAAAPFAVRGSGAGYGSSDSSDEGAHGEQWIPLWNQPSTLSEVSQLFREGRSQINGKSAERGADMARSVARMGVARGIKRFERYGYIERNGLSNLAVPLGRFDVIPRPSQDLLDEAVPWIEHLRRVASDKNAPESFDRAHRACEEAVFNCTQNRQSHGFLSLLVAMAKAEDQLVQSPRFAAEKFARPIPKLSERWLHVVREEENSVELNLGVALASQYGKLEAKNRSLSVRVHWLPLDGSYFAKGENGLSIGPEQSSCGLDLQRALIAMMHRRFLACSRGAGWSERDRWNFIPLRMSGNDLGAKSDDIQAFLEHRVDDARILAIARGLMAVSFKATQDPATAKPERKPLGGLALYGLLRLAMPVAPIWLPKQADKLVRCNPTAFYRLKNGVLGGAIQIATRQLAAAGLRPRVRIGVGSPQFARRLAASMAFGISAATTTRLTLGLTRPELGRDERRQLETAVEG